MIRKHYRSLEDCPIWNFKKCHAKLDLRYLLRSEYPEDEEDLNPKEEGEIIQVWESMNDEYIDEFGLTDRFKGYLEQKQRVISLQIDQAVTGDKSLKAIIKREERRLESLSERIEKSSTFEETVASVEKFIGVPIDPKKVTAKQYFTYIKMMEREAETLTAKQRRKNVEDKE